MSERKRRADELGRKLSEKYYSEKKKLLRREVKRERGRRTLI